MKPQKKLRDEQKLHAVTKGQGEPEKKLPETIALSRSQSLSITALANDEQRFNQQIQQLQQATQATQQARAEVLEEIATVAGISAADIALNYQFDGRQLVRPPQPQE